MNKQKYLTLPTFILQIFILQIFASLPLHTFLVSVSTLYLFINDKSAEGWIKVTYTVL